MNLLTEYMTLKQKEETLGITLPKPVYLFTEHYGRSLEEELPELAEAFGFQNYFSFSTDNLSADSNLYQSFYSQMQQAAQTGREFQGCILISLSDRIQEHDFTALITLIKSMEGIVPIFTKKSDADIHPLLPTYNRKPIAAYLLRRSGYMEKNKSGTASRKPRQNHL